MYCKFSYGAKCGLGPKFDQEETIWNDKVVSGQVEGQAVATEHIVPFFSFLVQWYTRLYLNMVLLYVTNSWYFIFHLMGYSETTDYGRPMKA